MAAPNDLDQTGQHEDQRRPWEVPLVLAVLMVSAGVFFVLIAHGLSILSTL